MRAYRSRPRWSVPNQYCPDGATNFSVASPVIGSADANRPGNSAQAVTRSNTADAKTKPTETFRIFLVLRWDGWDGVATLSVTAGVAGISAVVSWASPTVVGVDMKDSFAKQPVRERIWYLC